MLACKALRKRGEKPCPPGCFIVPGTRLDLSCRGGTHASGRGSGTAVAANAPQSVRGSKQAIQFYRAGYTEERRQQLRELAREAFESEDYKEGTRAFLEKRAPRFQGR